jgi:hypothetical protein
VALLVLGSVIRLQFPQHHNNNLVDHDLFQTFRNAGLTNILRDVGEDYRNGRIYFSKARLNEFNVSIADENILGLLTQ